MRFPRILAFATLPTLWAGSVVAGNSPAAAHKNHLANHAAGYDFTDYLRIQELETTPQAADDVQGSRVVIDGIPYMKLQSAAGTLYLPRVANLKPEDLSRALCEGTVDGVARAEVTAAKAELALTREVKLYSRLIIETLHSKCTGPRPAAAIPAGNSGLEVGVKMPGGSDRDPTTYSVFNRNLAPNIGVRADF